MTHDGWAAYAAAERARIDALDASRRRQAARGEDAFWKARHELARREAFDVFPPTLPADVFRPDALDAIDRLIGEGLAKHGRRPNPPVDDAGFLRRLSLDTIGLPPTGEEVEAFLADTRPDKRARAVDDRLADPRWADDWMGYWQDVLAENPGILKPTLNNTGPFRWWLHQAFLDNMPFDRFVTELVRMEGSALSGGPAGFGMATQNDAPMAAKAHVLAKAFLAADMKCARCHDAPLHPFEQAQLFALAGLLAGKPQVIPADQHRAVAGGGSPAGRGRSRCTPATRSSRSFDLGDIAPDDLPDGDACPKGPRPATGWRRSSSRPATSGSPG